MSWRLNHCFVGSPCGYGTPHVSRVPIIGKVIERWAPPRQCENDLGLGIGAALRSEVGENLKMRGFVSDPGISGSPWLWCLGGPAVLRAPHPDDMQADDCVDLILYVCETHQVISAEVSHLDTVAEWGGSGPNDPRQSEPVLLGTEAEAVCAAMAWLSNWLDRVTIDLNQTQGRS